MLLVVYIWISTSILFYFILFKVARKLNQSQAIEILSAHYQRETNPTRQQFKAWLVALGGETFFDAFIHAGYELEVIAEFGLKEENLDDLGIGREKSGLRIRLLNKHRLSEFYKAGNNDEEESDEEESEDEESEEESEED